MPRTYRHNSIAAAFAEPHRCEACLEFLATHVLRVYYRWGLGTSTLVCDDCLEHLVLQLQAGEVEYRVAAYSD